MIHSKLVSGSGKSKMKILVINPGSANTKFKLFANQKEIAQALIEGKNALEIFLLKNKTALEEIERIGIRIVHGGGIFTKPTKITPAVLKKLERISHLAPLHNPPALAIIKEIHKLAPKLEVWGVFDTAFHATLPAEAYTYPLPAKFKIRRYGFHGTACQSALVQLKTKLKKLPKKIIYCHLGGGCSITTVQNGKSIETTMGFTPLEGIMMVKRSGGIEAGVFEYLAKTYHLSHEKLLRILNNESGFLGMTGTTDIKKIIDEKNKNAKYGLAYEVFLHKVVKEIGASVALLGGVDALILAGGIGEKNQILKKDILKKTKSLGINSKNVYQIKVSEENEIHRQIA